MQKSQNLKSAYYVHRYFTAVFENGLFYVYHPHPHHPNPSHTDPNVRTKEGLTPLHFAARHLPRTSDTVTEAKGASDAKSTSRQVIQLLLRADGERFGSRPIDHEAKDNQGVTPLHMACSRGNVPAVQELLKYLQGNVQLCVKEYMLKVVWRIHL